MSKRLDIGNTIHMVGSTLDSIALQPEVALWCHEVLGYFPRIDVAEGEGSDYRYVHLIFRHDPDAVLFRINFAQKWA